jgi:hypothetical protein
MSRKLAFFRMRPFFAGSRRPAADKLDQIDAAIQGR